jgi:hypothetical protein
VLYLRRARCGAKMASRVHISDKVKRIVAASQKWRCAACKRMLSAFFETDHVRALSLGGSNHRRNLRALCPSCHRVKTNDDLDQLHSGFGRNFFMLFTIDKGQTRWYRGVVIEVTRAGYSVVFEDGDAMVVPVRKTQDVKLWLWVS